MQWANHLHEGVCMMRPCAPCGGTFTAIGGPLVIVNSVTMCIPPRAGRGKPVDCLQRACNAPATLSRLVPHGPVICTQTETAPNPPGEMTRDGQEKCPAGEPAGHAAVGAASRPPCMQVALPEDIHGLRSPCPVRHAETETGLQRILTVWNGPVSTRQQDRLPRRVAGQWSDRVSIDRRRLDMPHPQE